MFLVTLLSWATTAHAQQQAVPQQQCDENKCHKEKGFLKFKMDFWNDF